MTATIDQSAEPDRRGRAADRVLIYSVRQKNYIHNVFLFGITEHITKHKCGPEIIYIFSVAQDMFVALWCVRSKYEFRKGSLVRIDF